jgi:hypothetical protein
MSIFDAMRQGGQPPMGQPGQPGMPAPAPGLDPTQMAPSGMMPPPPLPPEMYENPTVDAGVLFPEPADDNANPFMGPQMGGMPPPAGAGGPPQDGQAMKEMLQQVLLQKAQARMQASQEFQKNALDTSQVVPNGGPSSSSSGF